MKKSIFTDATMMTKKAVKSEIASTKRAVREALRDYSAALDGALTRIAKSADKRSRDVANAVKGKYASEASEEITRLVSEGTLDARSARMYVSAYIVAKCYPWQSADGTLMCKRKEEREDGTEVRVWRAKKLTKASADGIMTKALDNFVNTLGHPYIEAHEDGESVSE